MQVIADLQIHSRYARACSNKINIENLEKYARIKGVNLLGTGDFQHPLWNKEIKEKLKEDENGILWTKSKFPFLWQTEVSLIYSWDGKGRRIHHLIYAPCKDVADQVIEALGKKGRLDYDGRPIFGFTSVELVEIMMEISKDIEIIPAHAFTSWFSLFGANSGFDSVKDCFQEKTKYIHAIETGLSADPEMCWRMSQLDKFTLVSNSDAHSFWPHRLGREATVFDCRLSYKNIINAIRTRKGLKYTIEVPPNLGKYHYTGHRNCGISLNPKESLKLKNICPKCNKLLTVGVEQRIEALADRKIGYKPENAVGFKTLIPLIELISAVYGYDVMSKRVQGIYYKLIEEFKDEYNILLNVEEKDLSKIVGGKVARLIMLNRDGKIRVKAGFDGVYGVLEIGDEMRVSKGQKSLKDF
jgi:uncharacterized protein (TIGR00375 family)